jgi:hypothetical protein
VASNVPHTVKMSLSGDINTVQTWSTGLWFSYNSPGGDPDSSQHVVDEMAGSSDLAGYLANWWTSIEAYASTVVRFTKATYYAYGADPAVPSMNEYTLPTPLSGTTSLTVPPEVALVASLRTARPGASGRGRSYFPLLAPDLQGDGKVRAACCTAVAASYSALLSAINAHDFGGSGSTITNLTASVVSRTLIATFPITRVDVDSRMDSQRRRQDKLPGLVYSAAV